MSNETTLHIPSKFLCPLTLEIMEIPLMNRYGHNFERDAIVDWLKQGNDTCPLTRNPLSISGLIHNVHLRKEIQHWKQQNGYGDECDETEFIKNKNIVMVNMSRKDFLALTNPESKNCQATSKRRSIAMPSFFRRN